MLLASIPALKLSSLINALPGCIAQGIVWGIMALGLFLTFRILDFADLTVDGSFATGGAVTVMLILAGWSAPAAMAMALAAGPGGGSGHRASAHCLRHCPHPVRHPYPDRSVFRKPAYYGQPGQCRGKRG